MDLTVPRRRLLTAAEEMLLGRRVQGDLRRLARFLLLHPEGLRRVLGLLEQAARGDIAVFHWKDRKEALPGDAHKAREAFEAARDPALPLHGARERLERARRVLEVYPIEPELACAYAREVAALAAEPAMAAMPAKHLARLLGKTLRALERDRDILVLSNLRLVLKEVGRFQPAGMDRSDLYQQGVMGLQRAVYRYEPERKTRFSTYATYWIRQSIRKALNDRASLIRVPQAMREELRKPVPDLPAQEVDRVRKLLGPALLFSDATNEKGELALPVKAHRLSSPNVDPAFHVERIPDGVHKALEVLPARERFVVERQFGIGAERQTLEEIGDQLNLSRERVRQIRVEALERLKESGRLDELYDELVGSEKAWMN